MLSVRRHYDALISTYPKERFGIIKWITRIGLMALLLSLIVTQAARAQILDKIRLGYCGTGIKSYVLEMGKRTAIFKKNGLAVEVVHFNSGSCSAKS